MQSIFIIYLFSVINILFYNVHGQITKELISTIKAKNNQNGKRKLIIFPSSYAPTFEPTSSPTLSPTQQPTISQAPTSKAATDSNGRIDVHNPEGKTIVALIVLVIVFFVMCVISTSFLLCKKKSDPYAYDDHISPNPAVLSSRESLANAESPRFDYIAPSHTEIAIDAAHNENSHATA